MGAHNEFGSLPQGLLGNRRINRRLRIHHYYGGGARAVVPVEHAAFEQPHAESGQVAIGAGAIQGVTRVNSAPARDLQSGTLYAGQGANPVEDAIGE